jgi:hypothetical protein
MPIGWIGDWAGNDFGSGTKGDSGQHDGCAVSCDGCFHIFERSTWKCLLVQLT